MNTGVAVAGAVCDPLTGPLMAYIEAYTHLLADPRWSMFVAQENHLLALLSVLNTELGYLPFIQLQCFNYSGHADHPTDSIAMLRRIWDYDKTYRRYIVASLSYPLGVHSDKVAVSLVLDPLGIPVNLGPSPESFIRQEIEQYLKTDPQVINRRLISVLNYLNASARERLAAGLMTIRPLDLSFFHKVMVNHVIGQSYAVLNKFTKLGSLARQAELDKKHKKEVMDETLNSGSFAHCIEVLSSVLARNILKQLNQPVQVTDDFFESLLGTSYDQDACGDQLSYFSFCGRHNLHLRCSLSLRLFQTSKVAGLLPERLYGPFAPSPWEQLDMSLETGRLVDGKSLSVMMIQPPTLPKEEMHIIRGPLKPYRGSATADSVKTTPLVNIKGLSGRTNIRSISY